jgi:hypothetical protein
VSIRSLPATGAARLLLLLSPPPLLLAVDDDATAGRDADRCFLVLPRDCLADRHNYSHPQLDLSVHYIGTNEMKSHTL